MTTSSGFQSQGDGIRHSIVEDALALITGTLFVALGLAFYSHGALTSGGTVGASLLVHFATGIDLGVAFFVLNIPFYLFAYLRMGWAFTLKTFAAVALLSAEAHVFPILIALRHIDPLFATVLGGLLIGVGLLILIRHRSSLGGFGVLALYLQERMGWSAGKVQMAADALVLTAALFVIDPLHAGYSLIGAAMINSVLWLNHRDGRYIGY